MFACDKGFIIKCIHRSFMFKSYLSTDDGDRMTPKRFEFFIIILDII